MKKSFCFRHAFSEHDQRLRINQIKHLPIKINTNAVGQIICISKQTEDDATDE